MKVARFVCPFVVFALATAMAQNPVPFINQPLVPGATAPGGPSFTFIVNGTGFVSASVVNWNGAPLATSFVTGSQVTATVPASDIATAGTASVTVTNPAPGGGVSNVMYFNVSSPAGSVIFTQLPPNPTSFGFGLVTTDLNGDGKLDLAYLDANGVVIQLGNGNGFFQSPVTYPVGNTPSTVVVGDFNGDGKLDLAVANTQDNTISILLGDGHGAFMPQITVPTAPAPLGLVTGDFNGDGKLDLAVGNRCCDAGDVGGVSILLGNGDGTFQNYVDYGTAIFADPVVAGDFNRDGKLDLIFVSDGSGLTFLQGNGDGTFQPPQSIPSDRNPVGLIAADLNGDGKLDLITADYFISVGGGAYVFLGNGDGTFQSAVEYASGRTSVGVIAEDLNADGKVDLVLANQDDDTISVLLGNGDGTFQNPTDFPTHASLSAPVGDVNGDGKMDLVLQGDSATVVFLQGQFPVASIFPAGLTFGQQIVGTTSPPQTVTLTNIGKTTLRISNIGITGANANYFAEMNNCPPTLGANANCQVNVTFTPLGSVSTTASLNIADNAPGSPQAVSLNGTTPAFLSPSNVTFPDQYVGTSGLPQTVTLMNTGNTAITVTSVTISPADFAPLNACGSTVAAGASCSIGVFFDPTASGTRTGTLTVTDNASDSPQTATLTGVGQDFSMAASGSATATVSPGGSAKYTLAVAPAGGFKQTVSFTCSGAPAGFTCSVPSSVTLNGSSTTVVTVTVSSGNSARMTQPGGFSPMGSRLAMWLALGGLPGLVIFGASTAKREQRSRRIVHGSALLCVLSLGLTWTACGGGGGSGSATPGTYSLMVTGKFTSGATTLTHNTNLTLVVQ